ncbi:hypothetical protein NMY22_g15715 [Coprinellus aureogranulatus]|nr:hypothetical protein NMY22_g15715 [Coprinellus aureogranulatus]
MNNGINLLLASPALVLRLLPLHRLLLRALALDRRKSFLHRVVRLSAPAASATTAARRSDRECRPSQRVHDALADDDSPSDNEDTDIDDSTPAITSSRLSLAGITNKKEHFDIRFKTATSSNEEVLEAQRKTWSLPVYQHFGVPTVKIEFGKIIYGFPCKVNPSVVVNRARTDESTSNLNRHVRTCPAGQPVTTQSTALTNYVHGHSYSSARHRVSLSLWCARAKRPYAIVEDAELVGLFKDLYAGVEMPSRVTVSRDTLEIHAMTKEHLKQELSAYDGKIHVGADGWTAPNVFSFIGATIHFVKDGALQTRILDFIKLLKAHTGTYLAERLAECFHDWGIENKVMAFVGDNASNNDTLVRELKVLVPSFRGTEFQVCCFAHILNLVAGAVLSPFASKSKKKASVTADTDDDIFDDKGDMGDEDFEEEVDDDNVAAEVAASDAAALDEVLTEDLDSRLSPLSPSDGSVARLAITKLRSLAVKIAHSPTLREGLKSACEKVGCFFKMLSRDVSTRWNSTSELSKSGIDLRPALDRLCIQAEFNKSSGVRLRRFRLSNEEWRIIEQLAPMLDVITYTTKEMSKSSTPLIHEVIPFIDGLTSYFDTVIDNQALHPAVRHAAMRGLKMLNKYYGRTDDSIVYRIAMMLHPRYKTQYFVKAGWDASWIEEAKTIIRNEWRDHYKPSADIPAPSPESDGSRSDHFTQARAHFSSILDRGVSTGDALEEWLSSPPVTTSVDPITYWSGMKATGHELASR